MRTTLITALVFILILAQGGKLPGDEIKPASEKARLQKALFAEEAERDLPKAAAEYEKLVEEYTEARKVGLSALYRLAEVRRKQERNEEAAKLYLRVTGEFPESAEARLSRENLAAMGVGLPAVPNRIPDDPDETKELRRLMMLARNSPEKVWDAVPLALNDSGDQTTSPLSKAARRGWLRVVKFLLEEHKKAGRKQRELDLALYSTARAGQVESCRLLFKHGATLAIAKNALVGVILDGHQAVGDWLLEQGVDINMVAQGRLENLENRRSTQRDSYSGEERTFLFSTSAQLTPLGAAIAADDPEWIDRLLKLGADVNYRGTEDDLVSITPLSIACWKGHAPLAKRLLDLGADPNSPDRFASFAKEIRQPASTAAGWRPLHYAAGKPEIVSLLLAAGADEEGVDAEGLTPLHAAAYLNAGKSCQLLLDEGAGCDVAVKVSWISDKTRRNPPLPRNEIDPFVVLGRLDNKEWTPIMFASAFAQQDDGGAGAKEVIQVLVEYGASLTPKSLVSSSRNLVDICPVTKLRLWLSELIHYPEYSRRKGISLALPAASRNRILVAHPEDASAPPSLVEALLSWVEPSMVRGSRSYNLERGFVRRIEEGGKFQKIPFVVADIATHPQLQWGDILEFFPLDVDAPSYVYPLSQPVGVTHIRSHSISLDPKIYLELFGQMEFSVTIVWPDRPRQQLLLRGGLRVYDPSRAEAPLLAPRALIKLLGGSSSQSLQITRSNENGGATIELPKDPDKPAKGIRLLEGDVLTVGPLDPEKKEKSRIGSIQLLEPETGFRWAQWVPSEGRSSEKSDKPAFYPTLFQFLTEFYLPVETFELESMSEVLAEEKEFRNWNNDEIADAVKRSGVAPWATIRHPDLREIWIDRLGGERIRVPLVELIKETSEKTPDVFHRCREADLELCAGDIVEIRVLPNQAKVPWKGFDAQIAEFMQRALTYDFKIGDTLEDLSSRQVQWTSPYWFETAAGPIAVSKTANKPFVMDVNELDFAKDGSFKWGLQERWLREGVLIQPKRGRSKVVRKSRMGGSAKHLFFEHHSGLDERGLLKSLRPRPIDTGTSSKTRRVHPLVPRSPR